MYNNYEKFKNDLESQLQSYQYSTDLYEMKKLNDTDEVENILILKNTIFIGTNRMQIKKLDGTIEKYNIERYYPVDERDEKIKELNKKVEELERRLNDEPTKHNKSNNRFNKSNANVDGDVEHESEAKCESISNNE